MSAPDRFRIATANGKNLLDSGSHHASGDDFVEPPHNEAMDAVGRQELDAKLEAVKADARASIAESSKETIAAIGQTNTQIASLQGQMLAEMQGLRADFATMLKDVAKEMAEAKVAAATSGEKVAGLQGSIAEVRGSIAAAQGSIDGLKSSISMFQWVIGVAVAVAAIGVAWLQLDLAKQPTAPASAERPIAEQAANPTSAKQK